MLECTLNSITLYLDMYFNSVFSDVFVIFACYSFIKLTVLTVLTELVWPSQFFNRRHSTSVISLRFRTFVEYFLKLRKSPILAIKSQFIKTLL